MITHEQMTNVWKGGSLRDDKSRVSIFYDKCCEQCLYGPDYYVCKGHSEHCPTCIISRKDGNKWKCMCLDKPTDDEIKAGECMCFVDKYEEDEDEYEFDPRDADCETQ